MIEIEERVKLGGGCYMMPRWYGHRSQSDHHAI